MKNFLRPYTILLPIYKEEKIIEQLIGAIKDLIYPKNLLQVLCLIESDDNKTLSALLKINLPDYFSILIVKGEGQKTKARACNFGLKYATGDYLVIFDAEDIHEKGQLLKAAKTFYQSNDPYLSCLQAKLTFYNYNTNTLTRLFTLEYFFHFNFILPAFAKYEIPIPLGGTSNHLRTSILKRINGWDEYNVTEDADLTYRLYKNNFKIKMLNSYTSEETVVDIKSWIKQRSRWIKGHIITFLVQSRTIFNINSKANSIKYVFSLYYFMGITSILSLFQFYWPILLYFFIYNTPSKVNIYLSITNFLLYIYCYLKIPLSLLLSKNKILPKTLIKYCFIFPIYIFLYTLPSLIAIKQLIFKPYKWEKTNHGNNLYKKTNNN